MSLTAIDISSWQHPNGAPIDWARVKAAGVQGVLIKATQGDWYVNPYFHGDAEGAAAEGLLVGAYHFAEPSTSTVEIQAQYFLQHVTGLSLAMGAWYDLEETGGLAGFELGNLADTWVKTVALSQRIAGLYVNLDFANMLTNTATFHYLWLANPSNDANPYTPWMVQIGSAPVDGVEGSTDMDRVPNSRGLNPPIGGPTPPPAPGPTPLPIVQNGSTGEAVKLAQEALNAKGATLTVDGSFGPLTHEAAVEFQQTNGLTVDGVIGPQTWGSLRSPESRRLAVEPGAETEIANGASGPAVTLCQRLLNELGAALAVDGAFGAETLAAVEWFQRTHSLTVDGVCGPLTWAALRAAT